MSFYLTSDSYINQVKMLFFSEWWQRLKIIRYKEIPEYFTLNMLIFKTAGSWMPHPKVEFSVKFSHYAYNSFLFLTAGIMVYFEAATLPITYYDLDAFVKNVSMLATHLLDLCKLIFWAFNHRKLFEMLNKLDDLTFIHGEYLVDPEISPEVYQEDFLPRKILAEEKKISDFALKSFFFFVFGVSCSAALVSVYTLLFDYKENYYFIVDEHNVTIQQYDQLLPYSSKIPFNYNSGRAAFFCAILYQFYALSYYAWNVIGKFLVFFFYR